MAGGQDVRDPVRAASDQRYAVVDRQRADLAAIGATTGPLGDERLPLRHGEAAVGRGETRASPVESPPSDLRVRPPIRERLRDDPDPVTPVVRSIVGTLPVAAFGMPRSPSLHRFARPVEIPAHPRTTVGAALLRISVGQLGSSDDELGSARPEETFGCLLRENDSNVRPLGYEPSVVPLHYPATSFYRLPRDA